MAQPNQEEAAPSKDRRCPVCGSATVEYDGMGRPLCRACAFHGEAWQFVPGFGYVVTEDDRRKIRENLWAEMGIEGVDFVGDIDAPQVGEPEENTDDTPIDDNSTRAVVPSEDPPRAKQKGGRPRKRRRGHPTIGGRLLLGRPIDKPWEDAEVIKILKGPGTAREKAAKLGTSHVSVINWSKKPLKTGGD